jgi:predicted Zn-dependent protease
MSLFIVDRRVCKKTKAMSGEYEEAAQELQALLDTLPKEPSVYLLLAQVFGVLHNLNLILC